MDAEIEFRVGRLGKVDYSNGKPKSIWLARRDVQVRVSKGSAMRVLAAALMVSLATAGWADGVDAKKVSEYLKTLPAVTVPVYDEAKRETLAASAISCTDHPEEAPANRNNYLWQ